MGGNFMGKPSRCRGVISVLAAIGVAGFVFGHLATSEAGHSGTVSRDKIKPFINAKAAIANHYNTTWMMETMGAGVCAVDVNNDGWDDIIIANDNHSQSITKFFREWTDFKTAFYLNRGDKDGDGIPEFEEVSEIAGIAGIGSKDIGCSVGDYDNDGDLDLYITAGVRGMGVVGTDGVRIATITTVAKGYKGATRIQGPFPPDVFVSYKLDGRLECEAGNKEEGGRSHLYRNDGNDSNGIPKFTDVAEQAGVLNCRQGSTSTFVDIDLDGDLDLFVGNWVDSDWMAFNEEEFFNAYLNQLFENNGDGTFTNITATAGDTDRKGYTFKFNGERIPIFNPELRDAKGRTVGEDGHITHVVSFMDYDNDRYPDLFAVADSPGGTIAIFHNNGDNTFTDVSESAGTDVAGEWMGIAWGDIDNDGDLDMENSNFGSDWYSKIKNTGELFMLESSDFNRWGKGKTSNSVWRFNGVKEAFFPDTTSPHKTVLAPDISDITRAIHIEWGAMPPNTVDHNNVYKLQSYIPLGWENTEFSFGNVFFDFDNDGHIDAYIAGSLGRGCGDHKCSAETGELPPGAEQFKLRGPGRLLQNLGREGMYWREVTLESQMFNIEDVNYETGERLAIDYHEEGRGIAKGDFNNDGYPDLVVLNAGGPADNRPGTPVEPWGLREFRGGPTQLFINPGYDNHWLKFKLEGTKTNRSAIGAVVRVWTPSGNLTVEQVNSGMGYLSNHSLHLLFGLGQDSEASKVEISWPSGQVDTFTNVKADQFVKVTEGGKLEKMGKGVMGNSPK